MDLLVDKAIRFFLSFEEQSHEKREGRGLKEVRRIR